MKKPISFFLLLFIFSAIAFSQNEDLVDFQKSTIGFELDVLPYITGGYYGSIWYGIDNLRFRGVIAKVQTPEFILEEGFEKNKIQAYAFIIDYFFDNNFDGFWVGTGIEYWKNRIGHKEETITSEYNNTIFTVGGGYVWKFYYNFYLNPWLAAHITLAGDDKVKVGNQIYEPNVFTPEISLKIGWHF